MSGFAAGPTRSVGVDRRTSTFFGIYDVVRWDTVSVAS